MFQGSAWFLYRLKNHFFISSLEHVLFLWSIYSYHVTRKLIHLQENTPKSLHQNNNPSPRALKAYTKLMVSNMNLILGALETLNSNDGQLDVNLTQNVSCREKVKHCVELRLPNRV